MPESVEHKFLKTALYSSFDRLSNTRLFGVLEADRKKFDYAATLQRDLERVLVSQVCWSNKAGIAKDILTLVQDSHASIKLYVIDGSMNSLSKIEDVVSNYRNNSQTRSLLAGLRILTLPPDFDADKESHRDLIANKLEAGICSDLLLGVIFGQLDPDDVRFFGQYKGVLGLKFALLRRIYEEPLQHMPGFLSRLGYSTRTVIDKAIIMLQMRRFIEGDGVPKKVTTKGRFLVDLIDRLVYESENYESWTPEMQNILRALGVSPSTFYKFNDISLWKNDAHDGGAVFDLLSAVVDARDHFGIAQYGGDGSQFYSLDRDIITL